MTVLRLALLISVIALTAMGQQNSPEQRPVVPAACPAVLFTPTGEREMSPGDKSGELRGLRI